MSLEQLIEFMRTPGRRTKKSAPKTPIQIQLQEYILSRMKDLREQAKCISQEILQACPGVFSEFPVATECCFSDDNFQQYLHMIQDDRLCLKQYYASVVRNGT